MSDPQAGLYLHVPFCARACPYCDFDFVVGRGPDVAGWLAAVGRELALRRAGDAAVAVVPASVPTTVYIGGGTPSLLGAAGIEQLGAWIHREFPGAGVAEWTVEVNPEHAEPELFAAIHATGGTRVSLGTQTFDPRGLQLLGRVHRRDRALTAIAGAVAAGLELSIDLIVGWPGQSPESLAADLEIIVGEGVRHVSVYALTVESGTPWQTLVRRGKRSLPDQDHQADMLQATEATLVAAGLDHYEIASYAVPGHEAQHNRGYWTWADYLGLGPSAHSAVFAGDGSVRRRGNLRGLPRWAEDPGTPAEIDVQAPTAAAREGLWTGLRLLRGIVVDDYLARFPSVDRAWLAQQTQRQVALGNLEFVADRLRVAPGRWLWHDTIAADLLA